MRAVHRNFARLRFEHIALHAHNIAEVVIFFESGVILLADVVAADVNLQLSFPVLNM